MPKTPPKVHDRAPDSPVARANAVVATGSAEVASEGLHGLPLIALVGNPNVGKSVVFHLLTGRYVVVSNYPGTTISLTRGQATLGGQKVQVCDTPGMYSLLPVTEEERIARRILLRDHPVAVVHVADAKSLTRMLPFTLQLIEAELPVILVLNLMDEAEHRGIKLDVDALRAQLGIPVVAMTATRGHGLDDLKTAIATLMEAAR